jgi:hypothetical protein
MWPSIEISSITKQKHVFDNQCELYLLVHASSDSTSIAPMTCQAATPIKNRKLGAVARSY